MKHLLLALSIILIPSFAFADAKPPTVWKKCKSCHTYEEGGKHKTGPNLYGIFGRTAGTAEGFKKYKALKGVDFIWNEENLDEWLGNPKSFAKKYGASTKTSMPTKTKKEKDRDALIEFLKTLTKNDE